MTTTKKRIVGKIYANWCGACKALEPAWKEMEAKVGGQVDVKEIESAEQDKKIQAFNKEHDTNLEVNGYPTMFSLNHGGSLEYYNGDRSVEALVKWALGKEQNGGKKKKSKKNKSKKNKSRKHRKH